MTPFLEVAAHELGVATPHLATERLALLGAVAHLCAQSITVDAAAGPAVLAHARGITDQLRVLARAAELMLAAASLQADPPRTPVPPCPELASPDLASAAPGRPARHSRPTRRTPR
jgi:hypothetical protein